MAPDSSVAPPSQSAPTEHCWLKGPIRRKTSPPIGQLFAREKVASGC